MNDDDLWAAIDAHRIRTADLLADLSGDEWQQPSLCADWTVRDVAAHLTMQQERLGAVLRAAIRHPGSMNRMIRLSARSKASVGTEQLIAEIRAMVGSRRHNMGVTARETLVDILVHSQDIAIPLHRELEIPTAAAVSAADRVWSYSGRSKARVFEVISMAGLSLTATDVDWTAGEGRTVEGPIAAILLLLTGRTAALAQLTGEGADALRQQLPA